MLRPGALAKPTRQALPDTIGKSGAMARPLTEIDVGDDAAPWRAAGFSVSAGDTVRIGTVAVNLLGTDTGRGIRGWGFGPREGDSERPDDDLLDGIATRASASPGTGPESHPNGSIAIDHVVVLSPDGRRTSTHFETFGLELRRTRDTDQYGMPMRQSFFRAGEVIVELIAPHEATDDGPASFFGLAYTVTDLDATAALLGDDLGRRKDAVQPGRRIATLRHENLGLSVPTAFMSASPR